VYGLFFQFNYELSSPLLDFLDLFLYGLS